MNNVLIIVGVVAIVVIVAAVLLIRGGGSTTEPAPELSAPEGEASTPAADAAAGPGVAEKAPRPRPIEPEAESEPPAATAEEPGSEPERAPAGEEVEAPPSPEEVRSQVQDLLGDAERMLGELRELEGAVEAGEASSADLMEEALQEVRDLANREEWSQAKDKAAALRSQVSLTLQSARREQTSS